MQHYPTDTTLMLDEDIERKNERMKDHEKWKISIPKPAALEA